MLSFQNWRIMFEAAPRLLLTLRSVFRVGGANSATLAMQPSAAYSAGLLWVTPAETNYCCFDATELALAIYTWPGEQYQRQS